MDHQKKALTKMHNGCILCGGVGSGKSLTAIAYYMEHHKGKQLYIITTARKRDTAEWTGESFKFGEDYFNCGLDFVIVDSWNNIDKYKDVTDAFFIFDEQRVVGGGVWAKDFIKIAKANHWILLSATPGDNWMDYIAVFVANGYHKNRTEFLRRHVVFDPYVTFPKVRKYVDVEYLIKCRDHCLVQMPFEKPAERHHRDVHCEYDENAYKIAREARWNEDEDKPIENASELCQVLRRISSSDESRLERVRDILRKRRKAIIFYNYNYELDILRQLSDEYVVAEWNGQKHENIPEGDSWVYLVQYTAGAEGWNCVTTDCVIFYSESYSYKAMEQACGRIDRLNTPYKNLWYFHLRSDSSIDKAVERCLKMKKDFNEKAFLLEG
jgi:hypothetical protein